MILILCIKFWFLETTTTTTTTTSPSSPGETQTSDTSPDPSDGPCSEYLAYMGDNLDSPEGGLTAEQCQQKCADNADCKFYSYSYPFQRCYIKNGKGNPTPLDGYFSASKNCPPLPPQQGNRVRGMSGMNGMMANGDWSVTTFWFINKLDKHT